MPQTILLLQSLIIFDILRHALRFFSSPDSTVATTNSARPQENDNCVSHLNCSFNFGSKLLHYSVSFSNSTLTFVSLFLDPIAIQKVFIQLQI